MQAPCKESLQANHLAQSDPANDFSLSLTTNTVPSSRPRSCRNRNTREYSRPGCQLSLHLIEALTSFSTLESPHSTNQHRVWMPSRDEVKCVRDALTLPIFVYHLKPCLSFLTFFSLSVLVLLPSSLTCFLLLGRLAMRFGTR